MPPPDRAPDEAVPGNPLKKRRGGCNQVRQRNQDADRAKLTHTSSLFAWVVQMWAWGSMPASQAQKIAEMALADMQAYANTHIHTECIPYHTYVYIYTHS